MIGENELHPLEIQDAREAANRATQKQEEVEDELRRTSKDFADKEREFRRSLAIEILKLKAEGIAVTACEQIAKGDEHVSDLRHARDIAEGELKAVEQQAFRRGADRKDVHQLLIWSQQRDLSAGFAQFTPQS